MKQRSSFGYVDVRNKDRKDLSLTVTFNGYTEEEARDITKLLQDGFAQILITVERKGETSHG